MTSCVILPIKGRPESRWDSNPHSLITIQMQTSLHHHTKHKTISGCAEHESQLLLSRVPSLKESASGMKLNSNTNTTTKLETCGAFQAEQMERGFRALTG